MARKRMIDPDFWTDEALGQVSTMERLLFMGLISQADDAGRLRGNAALIRSQIFPYDEEITASDVDHALSRLSDQSLIVRYSIEGQSFIWLPGFTKHQTINKPTESRLPAPETADISQETETTTPLPDDSHTTTVALPPKRREEKLKEEKGSERARDDVTTTTPVHDQPIEYVMALAEEMGQPFAEISPTFKSKQAGHGKKLREQGHSVDQVRRCIRWLKSDEWWISKGIDLNTITNQIGKFELAGEPATMNPGKHRNGKAREPDFSGIEAFDETMTALEQRR